MSSTVWLSPMYIVVCWLKGIDNWLKKNRNVYAICTGARVSVLVYLGITNLSVGIVIAFAGICTLKNESRGKLVKGRRSL